MDLLSGYDSDGGGGGKDGNVGSIRIPVVNAAPAVIAMEPTRLAPLVDPLSAAAGPSSKKNKGFGSETILVHNPKASEVLAPTLGPAHPFRDERRVPGQSSGIIGPIQKTSMEKWSFDEQFNAFTSRGEAIGPSGDRIGKKPPTGEGGGSVAAYRGGSISKKRARGGEEGGVEEAKISDLPMEAAASKGHEDRVDEEVEAIDVGIEEVDGIWAPEKSVVTQSDFEAGTMSEEQAKYREEYLESKALRKREFSESEFVDRRDERKMGHMMPPRHTRDTVAGDIKTQFHGKAQHDYQGRSWLEPLKGHRKGDGTHECSAPRKCIHRWTGHSKGVQAIQFFPGYGHLILSGSMDSKVKIWDVMSDRRQRRTYQGHSAAVRDVTFSPDGLMFLSASFDRFIRLWDTETGQCIRTFTNRKMPYCVTFNPKDPNIFLVGSSDNKIIQWDCTSGEIVQEYNHHLGPVNSVLFVDSDTRIVTTSDDKKVLIWEYGIPVPIKYISEPSMHSIPSTTLHPGGDFWVGQSLDNRILTWGARDKFWQVKKKVFKGHVNAGYACRMSFSPDGKMLCSGDGEGKMWIWDWKSTKVFRKVNAHTKGPCIDVKWHPTEGSWVASAGWDGNICLWSA